MSDDSAPGALDAKRRVRFEPSLNLNNFVSLVAIAASAVGLWTAMQSQQARMDVQISNLKEAVTELKAEVKEVRRMLEKR